MRKAIFYLKFRLEIHIHVFQYIFGFYFIYYEHLIHAIYKTLNNIKLISL